MCANEMHMIMGIAELCVVYDSGKLNDDEKLSLGCAIAELILMLKGM